MIPTLRRLTATLAIGLVLTGGLASCTREDPEVGQQAFCTRLRTASGPLGAESTFEPRDPDRLAATVEELRELQELAPDDIEPTVTRMLEVFEVIRQTPRDDLLEFLADNETEIATLATTLTGYSLEECRIILQRAPATPTPVPTEVPVTE